MKKTNLKIAGMHCASCAVTIEKNLRKLQGVKSASVNYATETASLEHAHGLSKEKIKEAVSSLGYTDFETLNHQAEEHLEHEHHAEEKSLRSRFLISFVLSIPLLYSMLASFLPFLPIPFSDRTVAIAQFILATGTIIAGWNFYYHGFRTVIVSK